jgi:hypothetical protein
MINLKDIAWFDQGANRVCYRHPDEPGKMLKVIKPWKRAGLKKMAAPWFKRLRPASCFDDNVQEFKAFRFLEKKPEAARYFPQCYGIVPTDLGDALCVEYIHSGDPDGRSLSLESYLQKFGFTDEIRAALDDLAQFLYRNLIVTRDLRGFNIMVRRGEQGVRLVIVDGLGNPEFIPVSNVFPLFGKTKIRRKLMRFRDRLERIAGGIRWEIPRLD